MKNKTLLFCLALFLFEKGHALPQGAEASHGQVEFLQSDSQNLIVHASDKAIINYKEFNIAERECVEFIQPNSSSRVLNRIHEGNASEILGTLKSNGKIFLVNPSGIYFGPNATVSTGSLIASVLDIKDQDFINDRYEFSLKPGSKNSEIINQGFLSSPEGVIALLAPHILNGGMITTQVGKVFLGGAEKITLDFHGDGMLNFVLEGEIENAVIQNQGAIDAAGGSVMLRMKAANRAIQEVINTDGVAVATQMIEENGIISLVDESYICAKTISIDGGDHSTLLASGKINAIGENGGSVELFADQIYLKGAEIDASGDFGGGTILIGGDYQGSGEIHKSKWTYMDDHSIIWADAKLEGNGGKVILWSNDKTLFNGSIFARGADLFGNGGCVETSGKNEFGTRTGYVNTLAPSGKVGRWLIDPLTINVVGGGVGTLAQAADCADVVTNLTIDPATISAAVSVVTLCASTSITVTNGFNMANPNVGVEFTANAGGPVPITLNDNITTQAGHLLLNGNVTLGAAVTLDTTAGAQPQGADVTINGTVNGSFNFTIQGGTTGSVNIANTIGGTAPLIGLTINAHGGIALGSIGSAGAAGATDAILTSQAGIKTIGAAYRTSSQLRFNGDLTLGSNTTMISGEIQMNGSVDAEIAGTQSLTATSTSVVLVAEGMGVLRALNGITLSGTTGIAVGSVGSSTPGSTNGLSFTASNSILNGGVYFTQGAAQTYTGAVNVNGGATLNSSSQPISFSSTIDGTGTFNIFAGVNTVTLNGSIGSTTQFTTLNVGSSLAGSIIFNAASVLTLGSQTYASPVTLNQNATFTSSGGTTGSIAFASTIDGNAAGRTLSIISVIGSISVGGAIGSTATAMGSINIGTSQGATLNGVGLGTPATGAFAVSAPGGILLNQGTYRALSQDYTGHITLSNSAAMTSTNNILIIGGIDPVNNAMQSFTATSTAGSISIDGDIGSQQNALVSLSLTAATTINIDSVGSGPNNPGTTAGMLLTAPTSITLNGGSYTTQGGIQTYTGPVILGASTTLTSTNQNISFSSTIVGTGNRLTIDQGTGTATFNGTIGLVQTPLSLTVGTSLAGSIIFNTSNAVTTGTQTYGSPAILNQNFQINTTDSAVSFASTINGNAAGRIFTILSGQGSVIIEGAIGSTATAMGSITLTGNAGMRLTGIGTGAATTGNALLTSTAGMILNGGTYSALSFMFGGPIRIANNTTITSATNNNISFLGTVDTDGIARTLAISTGGAGSTGTVSTVAPMGSISPFGSLSINSQAGAMTLNGIGDSSSGSNSGFTLTTTAVAGITLNSGNYNSTGGAQQFNGNVTLGGNASLISNNQAINFANPVNGGNALTITAGTGAVTFNAAVGATTRLGAVTFNSANGVTFSSTLTAASINQTASTGANLFTGAVNTNTIQGITLNTTTVTFSSTITTTNNGPVSINNSSTLTMPALTYNISGAFSQIGAGSVSTATNITTANGLISFAGPVTLTGGITLNSSAGGGNISFVNTLNGANTLTLTSGAGTILFNQAVGGVTPLTQITTTGQAVDQNSSVVTTGAISYTVSSALFLAGNLTSNANNVTITGNLLRDTVADATITAGNNISITGTLDADSAGKNLTIAATGSATLGNVIGDVTPLNNFTVTANVINIADIGDGSVGVAGITTLTSATAINFTGSTYLANQQNYTGTSFNLGANSPTSFAAESNTIVFTGGPINLGNNGSLIFFINNSNLATPEITGNGSQSLFIFCPNGSISIGRIDPLDAVYQTAGSILITDTIDASSVTLVATAGNILNDVGGPFLVTAIDYISMNAIGGSVGTFADPISISTTGPAFAGATTNAYFIGVTGDNIVHCLPSNPPTQLWFNGVNIGCGVIPVPTPTPTPHPSVSPGLIERLEGEIRKAFYVAGLYSFYYNLTYDVYFVRDLVNMDSIERPQYLFYGKR